MHSPWGIAPFLDIPAGCHIDDPVSGRIALGVPCGKGRHLERGARPTVLRYPAMFTHRAMSGEQVNGRHWEHTA